MITLKIFEKRDPGSPPASAYGGGWNIYLSNNQRPISQLVLKYPSITTTTTTSSSSSSSSSDSKTEELLRWYYEKYQRDDPYAVSKAESAEKALTDYGQSLASQLVSSGQLPPTAPEVRIEIHSRNDGTASSGDSGSIQRLHWEVLENSAIWPQGYSFGRVMVQRVVDIGRPFPCEPSAAIANPISRFNILMVVARPNGRDDVDPQLVSRAIVDTCSRISKLAQDHKQAFGVVLDILRPPTWGAFLSALASKGTGHYHLVHFDMHGRILKANTPDAKAVLDFCGKTSQSYKSKRDPVAGEEIAYHLVRSKVKAVIINACRSADGRFQGKKSNLAEVLVNAGVPAVVAMSYKATESAVEVFMDALYQGLLIRGLDVLEASHAARAIMLKHPQRRAPYFMKAIDMVDYIVPVLYHCSDRTHLRPRADLPMAAQSPPGSGSSPLERLASLFWGLVPAAAEPAPVPLSLSRRSALVGRETHILELELLLSSTRHILLYGQGGCGKTALLKYCSQWWVDSGWVQDFVYVDFAVDFAEYLESRTRLLFGDILKAIAKKLSFRTGHDGEHEILKIFQTERLLLVVDSIELLNSPPYSYSLRMAANEVSYLKNFIKKVSSSSKVILSSRLPSCDSLAEDLDAKKKYLLPGLSTSASVQLAESLIAAEAAHLPADLLKNRVNMDFLIRILILLEGNPTAIKFVIPCLKHPTSSTPELLLHQLISGSPAIDMDSEAYKSCRVIESIVAVMMEGPRDIAAVEDFQVFWNTMPKDLSVFYFFRHARVLFPHIDHIESRFFVKDLDILVKAVEDAQGFSAGARRTASELEQVGVFDRAQLIQSDGRSEDRWHVNPLFTLHTRRLTLENRKGASIASLQNCDIDIYLQLELELQDRMRAFVQQQLQLCKETEDPGPTQVVKPKAMYWNNGEEQHPDHLRTHFVNAVEWSLIGTDSGLNKEIEISGVSLADAMFMQCCDIWRPKFEPERELAVLFPMLKRHVARLYERRRKRGTGVPDDYDIFYLTSHALNVIRALDGKIEAVEMCKDALRVFDAWRSHRWGQPLPPGAEQTFFELRWEQAQLVQTHQGDGMARLAFENNLGEDPSSHHWAWNAIRRVQLQNLVAWLSCIIGPQGLSNLDAEGLRAARDALTAMPVGSFAQCQNQLAQCGLSDAEREEQGPIRFGIPKSELERILRRNQSVINEKFGSLAKQILAEGEIENMRDQIPEGQTWMDVVSGMMGKDPATQRFFQEFEQILRQSMGDIQGARNLLLPQLQTQVDHEAGAGMFYLRRTHYQGMELAIDAKDWKRAMSHLKEIREINEGVSGRMEPEDAAHFHLRYAQCLDGLGDRWVEAAQHVLRAFNSVPAESEWSEKPMLNLPGFSSICAGLDGFPETSASGTGTSGVSGLNQGEIWRLKRMLAEGREEAAVNERVKQASGELEKKLRDLEDLCSV